MASPGWVRRVRGMVGVGAGCALQAGIALADPGLVFPPSAPASYLVDAPTAGLPAHGAIEARAALFPGGGMEIRLDAGILDRIAIGAGFGGTRMIGDGKPDWYPRPGFALRCRVLEESWTTPAICVGVDTRGGGAFDEDLHRFQFKSRGVFAVASKNYALLGDLALHGGASRSFESRDDGDPTLFGGVDKSLGSRVGVSLEYDLATNDDERDGLFGMGRGWLNGSLRLEAAPQLVLRFSVRDMLENSEPSDPSLADTDTIVDEGWARELSLTWFGGAF